MQSLKKAIDAAGGVAAVAQACEKSPRAVYKWLSAGRLPRTDYTGETSYAQRICALATANGAPVEIGSLLASALPTMAQTIPANSHQRNSTVVAVNPSSAAQASP
ncbi:hypothetical protein [Pseudomonas juntendi]|uniref:hypothetical protein n=1 Tax=Pseudomonas juntendi TaxID=2666183 RepID=UPI00279BFDCF|nr:hypothetical protein QJS63_15165 [Pseudomonas juntendi]